jgi:hypothetical protein
MPELALLYREHYSLEENAVDRRQVQLHRDITGETWITKVRAHRREQAEAFWDEINAHCWDYNRLVDHNTMW